MGKKGELEPKIPMKCRHQDLIFRPTGIAPCRSAGTREAKKASGFVKIDFKNRLRAWLVKMAKESEPKRTSTSGAPSGEESELTKQATPEPDDPSRTISKEYAVAEDQDKRGKQRAHLITYLFKESDSFQTFYEAYHKLIDTTHEIAHLCGCGLCDSESGSCCQPDHLALLSKAENLGHIKFHGVVKLCGDKDLYGDFMKVADRIPEFRGLF